MPLVELLGVSEYPVPVPEDVVLLEKISEAGYEEEYPVDNGTDPVVSGIDGPVDNGTEEYPEEISIVGEDSE